MLGINQLWATRFGINLAQHRAHSIIDSEGFSPNKLAARQQSLCVVTQINNNIVSRDFLYHAGQELANSIAIQLNNLRAFRLSHSLNNDLLRGLCGNPAKIDVIDHFFVNSHPP